MRPSDPTPPLAILRPADPPVERRPAQEDDLDPGAMGVPAHAVGSELFPQIPALHDRGHRLLHRPDRHLQRAHRGSSTSSSRSSACRSGCWTGVVTFGLLAVMSLFRWYFLLVPHDPGDRPRDVHLDPFHLLPADRRGQSPASAGDSSARRSTSKPLPDPCNLVYAPVPSTMVHVKVSENGSKVRCTRKSSENVPLPSAHVNCFTTRICRRLPD